MLLEQYKRRRLCVCVCVAATNSRTVRASRVFVWGIVREIAELALCSLAHEGRPEVVTACKSLLVTETLTLSWSSSDIVFGSNSWMYVYFPRRLVSSTIQQTLSGGT